MTEQLIHKSKLRQIELFGTTLTELMLMLVFFLLILTASAYGTLSDLKPLEDVAEAVGEELKIDDYEKVGHILSAEHQIINQMKEQFGTTDLAELPEKWNQIKDTIPSIQRLQQSDQGKKLLRKVAATASESELTNLLKAVDVPGRCLIGKASTPEKIYRLDLYPSHLQVEPLLSRKRFQTLQIKKPLNGKMTVTEFRQGTAALIKRGLRSNCRYKLEVVSHIMGTKVERPITDQLVNWFYFKIKSELQ